jgi:pyridoxine kinase
LGKLPESAMRYVLSIQSSVAHGHVGNSAAAFALQRMGRDVMRVDTVRFSNHPAHGGFSGGAASAAEIDTLVDGLAARRFLDQCAAVLSGYLGTAANGEAVARAVKLVRAASPGALFVCDPVMGDDPKGLFVQSDIPAVMREVLAPAADIVTPNRFELETLTGLPCDSRESVLTAARQVLDWGPQTVVVTGLAFTKGRIETLAVTQEAAWSVLAPRIEGPAFGAGDTFCAVFLARWLEQPDVARAVSLACASVRAILRETVDELALIPAQSALVAPPEVIAAVRL